MKNLSLFFLAVVLLFGLAACTPGEDIPIQGATITDNSISEDSNTIIEISEADADDNYSHVLAATTVSEVIDHPAFEGFGQYVLPVKTSSADFNSLQLSNIDSLLPYHSHIQTDTTVEVINNLIDRVETGETIFYDIYDQQQKQEDPSKEATGLFFFRGEPDAPVAIVSAGGGFSYVGSIHESFPHAMELSKKGYNAFALEYRIAGQQAAVEDLAAAITFVFEHAEEFGVSTEGYSLWGGSAGARMAATIGSHGVAAFGGADLPNPSAVVIAYTGHSDYSENDTPTFTMVSEDDPLVNVSAVDRRVENLRNAGIEVEYKKYLNAGHGFGLGIGTDAEGWFEDAVRFWETYLPGSLIKSTL